LQKPSKAFDLQSFLVVGAQGFEPWTR
jgi:hypothetical protein